AGHPSGRISLGYGFNDDTEFEELSLRPALHDLPADPAGYIPNSQLEMFHLLLRYNNDRGHVYVERLGLLDIVSLAPLDRWIKRPSWKFFTGWGNAKDTGRPPDKGLHFDLNAGTGPTLETSMWKKETFYLLAESDLGVGGLFRRNYRWGVGGTAGCLVDVTDAWRVVLEETYLRYPLGEVRSRTRTDLTQSFTLNRRTELRLILRRDGPWKETLLTANYYL
ncbi:MAG TPA: hypothetical protein P5079_08630, partial [Elusimicrobiota bacterium]|nr:hypothetical protein [Elusimicrobiota bacterium]